MEEKSLQLLKTISDSTPDLSAQEKDILFNRLESGIVKVGISAELALKWYALYLTGYSYIEIHKTYDKYELADILWAAYKFKWYENKINHIIATQKRVSDRLQLSRPDTVDLLLDKLKAMEVYEKEQLKKYISNPSGTEVPDSAKMTTRQLKEIVEIIEKLTNLGKPIQPTEINLNFKSEDVNKIVREEASVILANLAKQTDDMSDND